MDAIHHGTTVRPWFLAIGITEAILIVLSVIVLVLYFCEFVSPMVFVATGVLLILWGVKEGIWLISELNLYGRCILPYCEGGVKIYASILAVTHSSAIVIVIIFLLIR